MNTRLIYSKRNKLAYIGNIGILISLVISLLSFTLQNLLGFLLAISLIWLSLVLYNFNRYNFPLFSFYITFFTFLLGTAFIGYFDSSVVLRFNDEDALYHTYECLYIALITTHLGSLISERLTLNFKNNYFDEIKLGKSERNDNNERLLNISKYFFYFCSIFSITLALEKMFFTLSTGSYTLSYVDLKSNFPSFFQIIDRMTMYSFFIYLACLPDPRKSKFVFMDLISISTLLLIRGQRTPIVMTILIIIIYIILYENEIGEPFSIIKKKFYVIGILLIPFIMTMFDYIMAFRDSREYNYISLWNSIEHTVSSLGGSINVIGYGYLYNNSFPPGKIYSFGELIDFFTKNIFSRVLFGTNIYPGYNVMYAVKGNSFSHAITYIVQPKAYLNGYGMGSSYIAEAFHDFGYWGICLFSLIYGFILKNVNSLKRCKIIRNASVITATYYILLTPRSNADSFLTGFFNLSFFLTVAIIYFLSRIVKSLQS